MVLQNVESTKDYIAKIHHVNELAWDVEEPAAKVAVAVWRTLEDVLLVSKQSNHW